MTVYVVGKYVAQVMAGAVWELQGVFNSEDKAIDACRDSNYFYIAISMNENAPHESTPIQAVYPK